MHASLRVCRNWVRRVASALFRRSVSPTTRGLARCGCENCCETWRRKEKASPFSPLTGCWSETQWRKSDQQERGKGRCRKRIAGVSVVYFFPFSFSFFSLTLLTALRVLSLSFVSSYLFCPYPSELHSKGRPMENHFWTEASLLILIAAERKIGKGLSWTGVHISPYCCRKEAYQMSWTGVLITPFSVCRKEAVLSFLVIRTAALKKPLKRFELVFLLIVIATGRSPPQELNRCPN